MQILGLLAIAILLIAAVGAAFWFLSPGKGP